MPNPPFSRSTATKFSAKSSKTTFIFLRAAAVTPHANPSGRYKGSSTKSEISNGGTSTEGSAPRTALLATVAKTLAKMTISVVTAPALVSPSPPAFDPGTRIDSNPKNNPEIGAPKPALNPAAPPAANNPNLFGATDGNAAPTRSATAAPISTLGPSGPSEHPVPSVIAAAAVFASTLTPTLTSSFSSNSFKSIPA